MALVHEQSCPCVKTELDLFTLPPTQTAIENGMWIEHQPLSTLSDNAPIEFLVTGSSDDYIDVAHTYIYLKAKIVNNNGTNLADDANVAATNNWLHSIFSQVDVSLNEKLVTPSTNTYAYRAYIENLLSYGSEAKKTQLQCSIWEKDSPGHMETIGDDNRGLARRKAYTVRSNEVEMMGKLHADIFFQDKYLLNKVTMKVRCVRSKDSFALMATGINPTYKIKIQEAILFVRKVKINSTIQVAHMKALEKGSAKYPIRRIETKLFSISQGSMTANHENLFLGQLPTRIVIGMVDNNAMTGDYTKNPYNFKHHNLNFLALYLDGQQIPSKPLTPNFARNCYTRSYMSLFTSTGKGFQDEGNHITRSDYAEGYTLFAFDLTPDLSDNAHFNLIKQGSLRVEMHFAEALQRTINVVVYAEFESVIQIDRNRNVMFDYSA
jgi:hypothetical protein